MSIISDISRHMRTTVRLDDALLEQAQREARRRGQTFTALMTEGLRLILAKGTAAPKRHLVVLPTCKAGGGTLPGVDLNDSAALVDIMEERT